MNPIRPFLDHTPQIHESCLIDETSVIIGEVSLAEDVSVWPYAVLRGDVNSISIGARSNVQDGSVLHVSHKNAEKPEGSPLIIGEDVTVGHKVMLHGCRIGDRVLIGMGTIILDDTVIEDDVMIGAGSLVPPRKRLESGWDLCKIPFLPTAEIQTKIFGCFCFKYPLILLKYPHNSPWIPNNQASGRLLGGNRHT